MSGKKVIALAGFVAVIVIAALVAFLRYWAHDYTLADSAVFRLQLLSLDEGREMTPADINKVRAEYESILAQLREEWDPQKQQQKRALEQYRRFLVSHKMEKEAAALPKLP